MTAKFIDFDECQETCVPQKVSFISLSSESNMAAARPKFPPCETIYINNLNEKIKRDELRASLYAIFSNFGKIIDIHVRKTLQTRGQAWICFNTIEAATEAMNNMQGFPFYDKEMAIGFAKTRSKKLAEMLGEDLPAKTAKYEAEEEMSGVQETAPPIAPIVQPTPAAKASDTTNLPNNMLFVDNLPEKATTLMVEVLFKQFPGFVRVRMTESRPGIAFVEFDTADNATVVMSSLQGFKMTADNMIRIVYAK